MTSNQISPTELRVAQRRAIRIAIVGSILVMTIAYPVLISLKLADVLPQHLDWSRVLCGPAAFCTLLLAIVWLGNWLDLHRTRRRLARRRS